MKDLDKDEIEVLRKEFRLWLNFDIISLKAGQLHAGRELTVSW